MRVTVAEPQVRGREAGDERSGRQTHDHRNTNRQRGRMRAASVLGNTKPRAHQDASGRAGWRVGKVQVLTRGDLRALRRAEVSRGRSSQESRRKAEGAKGRSIERSGLTESRPSKPEVSEAHGAATAAATMDRPDAEIPVKPGKAAEGETKSRWTSQGERKP